MFDAFDADLLVGAVAIAVGSLVVLAAVFNWQWYYQLQKARWVESWCGRNGARFVFACLGLALIVLGGAIAAGFNSSQPRPNHQKEDSGRPQRRPLTSGATFRICSVNCSK